LKGLLGVEKQAAALRQDSSKNDFQYEAVTEISFALLLQQELLLTAI